MKFQQNFNEMAIRSYGPGYQAPSTALFNTDLATLEIDGGDDSIQALEIIKMPDFIEVMVELVSVPLPVEQNYTATYGFNETTWPPVPLYPSQETQFVSALNLLYAGAIKIRQENQRESILIRGKNIEGYEINIQEEEPIYTHHFEYKNGSVDFHVMQTRHIIPVWPVGGFYRPGCQMDQIQQVFCSLSEREEQTLVRKTLLYQWNDQGFYPPLSNEVEEQKTVFQTSRTQPYLKFIEEIRQGKALLNLVDPRASSQEQAICFTYKSIDIKEQGLNKALVYFVRV